MTARRASCRGALAAGLLSAALLACSGDGEGVDVNGSTTRATAKAPPTASVRADSLFAQVQSGIFSAICAECHAGGNAPMGLQLGSGSAAALVGRSSQEKPEILLVKPGDPENSYLVHKIEGRAGIVGKRMPRDLPPLSPGQIALVRGWVTALGSAVPADTSKGGNPKDTSGGGSPPRDTSKGTPPGTGGIRPGPATRSDSLFQTLESTVFNAICSECHVGSGAPHGLQLGGGASRHIVGRSSDGKPGMLLVKPGKPEESYLLWKVEGRAGIVGERMPRNLPALPAESIRLMKEWIASLPADATPGSVGGKDSIPRDTLVPGTPEYLFREAKGMVFGPICSQCHIGNDPPKGLLLSGDHPKAAIGRASEEEKGVLLIKPGDPDNSYLVWKIEGRRQINGDRMPKDQPPLSEAQIEAVRAWIQSLK